MDNSFKGKTSVDHHLASIGNQITLLRFNKEHGIGITPSVLLKLCIEIDKACEQMDIIQDSKQSDRGITNELSKVKCHTNVLKNKFDILKVSENMQNTSEDIDAMELTVDKLKQIVQTWTDTHLISINVALNGFSTSLLDLCNIRIVSGLSEELDNVLQQLANIMTTTQIRSKYLLDRAQRDNIQVLRDQIQYMLKVLVGICMACLHDPMNKGLKDFKSSVLLRLQELTESIKVEVGDGSADPAPIDANRFQEISQNIHHIVEDHKANPSDTNTFLQELKKPLEESFQHLMAIASFSASKDKNEIMSCSKEILSILEVIKEFSTLEQCLQNLEVLGHSYTLLEMKVEMAIVGQVVTYLTDPFTVLLKIAKILDGEIEGNINQLLKDHQSLTDHLFDLGGCARLFASRDDAFRMENCMVTMDWLDKFLISSIHETCKDKSLLPKVMFMIKIWIECIIELRCTLDKFMRPWVFLTVCKEQMHQSLGTMNEFYEDQDGSKIIKGLDEAVIMCGRVIRYQVNTQCLSSTQQVQLNRVHSELTRIQSALKNQDRKRKIMPNNVYTRVQLFWTFLKRASADLNPSISQGRRTSSLSSRRSLSDRSSSLPPGVHYKSCQSEVFATEFKGEY